MPKPVVIRVREKNARARVTSKCIQCGRRPPVAGGVRCAECREVNRQARRRREGQLREAGLCLECRVGECETGQTRCAKCRARYKDRAKEAKRMGLCVSCYKRPANLPHVQCSICAETRRRSEKVTYRKRLAVGLCVNCGKHPAVTKVLCRACARYTVATTTSVRNRYAKQGLCKRCGKRRPVKGRIWCAECFRSTTAWRRRKAKQLDTLGLCVWCRRNPRAAGFKLCESCRQQSARRRDHARPTSTKHSIRRGVNSDKEPTYCSHTQLMLCSCSLGRISDVARLPGPHTRHSLEVTVTCHDIGYPDPFGRGDVD